MAEGANGSACEVETWDASDRAHTCPGVEHRDVPPNVAPAVASRGLGDAVWSGETRRVLGPRAPKGPSVPEPGSTIWTEVTRLLTELIVKARPGRSATTRRYRGVEWPYRHRRGRVRHHPASSRARWSTRRSGRSDRWSAPWCHPAWSPGPLGCVTSSSATRSRATATSSSVSPPLAPSRRDRYRLQLRRGPVL